MRKTGNRLKERTVDDDQAVDDETADSEASETVRS